MFLISELRLYGHVAWAKVSAEALTLPLASVRANLLDARTSPLSSKLSTCKTGKSAFRFWLCKVFLFRSKAVPVLL